VPSTHRPVLLLLKGHPGSGKSAIGVQIARMCRWPLVDKDDSRDALALSPLAAWAAAADDGDSVLNEVAYSIMFRQVGRQLQCGMSVVVDCPLARVSLYETARSLAAQVGGPACAPAASRRAACRC